ncbi:MAG TPA: glycogen/starch synthase [Candidatus Limnocylindrales bacterium]|nr:glycogen/starch synthase [Candidatus Limnocylindrales bacterium]
MPAPLRVAFVAAECEPWAKTGGLGDVTDALARSLASVPGATDGPVDVFLPRYRSVPVPQGAAGATTTVRVPDPNALAGAIDVSIVDVAANGYRLRLVDHPAAFDRDGLYGPPGGGDFDDNAWRFGLLCRAALETLRADAAAGGRPVDVVHLHDWHACPVALYRDRWYADDPVIGGAAVVLSLHNLAYHGWTPRDQLRDLGLAPGDGVVAGDADGIDLLGAGIERAEIVNTVSEGYARESLTPELGFGLDGALRAKGDRYLGILNGLDTALWNPATDSELAAPYSAADLAGKAACRIDLLQRLGFDPTDDAPVLGMIGRLDPQKGFDLLAEAAPRLIQAGARLVVQGSGNPEHAAGFRSLAAARPDRVALIERFDRAMARRIYAGADLFLMPSRFEPSGQGQMIAMRYGTPPIVRRTGGLADSVVDELRWPGEGTGFAFGPATADALADAAEAAMVVREVGGPGWDGLVARAMATDFDWVTGSAPRYAAMYERAVALRRG